MKHCLKIAHNSILCASLALMTLGVRSEETFTRSQIHALAIGNLQIDVDPELNTAILELRLKETSTIGQPEWSTVPLVSSMVSVDDDGTLRLSIPSTNDAAFYKIVSSESDVSAEDEGEIEWVSETITGAAGYLSHPPIPGSLVINGGSTLVSDHISVLDDGNGNLFNGVSISGKIDYFSGAYGISNNCSSATAQYATRQGSSLPQHVTESVATSGHLSKKPCAGSVVITAKYTSSGTTFTYYGFDYFDGTLWGKRPHSNSSDMTGIINYDFGTFVIHPYNLSQVTISYVPAE